ncbi:MAG: NlpC/P60 family protein [Smithellaceae bacterium]
MMKRRIFLFSVLFLISLSLGFANGASAKQYVVKKGENLNTVAKKTGVSVKELKLANGLKGTKLKSKQVLNIPQKSSNVASVKTKNKQTAKKSPATTATYYTVKKGDKLPSIAKKTGVPVKQILALNNIKQKKLKVGQRLLLAKAPAAAPSKPEKEPVADVENTLSEDDDLEEDVLPVDSFIDTRRDNHNSDVLGKWGSPDERKLFVKVATGFLGAPYRLGGSTVRGIDCSAFVRKIYQLFDISLPRTAYEQSNVGRSVAKNELLEGDLVFFRTKRPVGHVGIYIGNGEFVHASSKDRAVRIDNLDAPYFYNRFVRAVRVKGLKDKGV